MAITVDPKSLSPYGLGALAAGVLAFIFSFVNRYAALSTGSFGGFSGGTVGTNAWDSFAVLGMLLVLIATGIIAVKLFLPQTIPATVPVNLIATVVAGLGALLLILRAITYGHGVNPGWSGYVLFVLAIALTVFAALEFRASGEKMPDFQQK